MTDLTKTLAAIIAAIALVGLVRVTRPTPLASQLFSDEGEAFFPEFTDPLEATTLEVVGYDEEAATTSRFKVELRDGRWVIPSHHDYPADAEQNMSRAASALIGLRKDIVISDRAADHESMGVLDPDDVASLAGRGTRVTLSAPSGRELASIIIGNEVDAARESGAGRKFYVRVPGHNRVYAVGFDSTFSTDFADWIETDLLQIAGRTINQIVIDRYEVDESAGQKIPIENLTLTRSEAFSSTAQWTLAAIPAGPPGPGEKVDHARVNRIVTSLGNLTIVGVRPKPQRLARWFSGEVAQVTQADVIDLSRRGFFVTGAGNFAANEGELRFTVDDGVYYTIYFGELLLGQGRTLTSGLTESDTAPPTGESDDRETRYAFVHVGFDPSLVPEPDPPVAGEVPEGDAPDQGAADDTAQQAYEGALAQRDKALERGRTQAGELSRRFAQWYYVIDATDFDSLRPLRNELVIPDPDAAQDAAGTSPAAPGN